MTIHAPTKEQVDNIPFYLSSPYLDEVNAVKDVVHNAQITNTQPDLKGYHDISVNAVDPQLLPKKRREELEGTSRDSDPGLSHLQQQGEYDWRIEAGQGAPMHAHSVIPPKVKSHLKRMTPKRTAEEGYTPAYTKDEVAEIYKESHVVSPSVEFMPAEVSLPMGVPSDTEPGQVNFGDNPPEVQSQVQQDLADEMPAIKKLETKPKSKIAAPTGTAKVKDKGAPKKPKGKVATADDKNKELRKLAGKDEPSAKKVEKELKDLEKERKPVARKRPATRKRVAK